MIEKTKHDTHRWPWFLPDGKHFLFLATSHTGGDPKPNGIYFGSVDNKETHQIVASDSAAQYASGYLLYRANTALVAQPFDPEVGHAIRDRQFLCSITCAMTLACGAAFSPYRRTGLMVYQLGNAASAKSSLAWFDRSGKALADFDPGESTIIDVRLSPDNKRVAFASGTGIWTMDLERKTKTRITFDQQIVEEPTWSADGKTIMFSARMAKGGGNVEIRSKAADGSGAEKTLIAEQNNYHYPAWSPDGKYLTYVWGDGEKMVSLWIVPVAGNAKPVAIVQPPSAAVQPL